MYVSFRDPLTPGVRISFSPFGSSLSVTVFFLNGITRYSTTVRVVVGTTGFVGWPFGVGVGVGGLLGGGSLVGAVTVRVITRPPATAAGSVDSAVPHPTPKPSTATTMNAARIRKALPPKPAVGSPRGRIVSAWTTQAKTTA
ncbi:hypothetical protein GCM10029976_051830 [Kribbella albertanoniae]